MLSRRCSSRTTDADILAAESLRIGAGPQLLMRATYTSAPTSRGCFMRSRTFREGVGVALRGTRRVFAALVTSDSLFFFLLSLFSLFLLLLIALICTRFKAPLWVLKRAGTWLNLLPPASEADVLDIGLDCVVP